MNGRGYSRKLSRLDEGDEMLVGRDGRGAGWEAEHERLFGGRRKVIDARRNLAYDGRARRGVCVPFCDVVSDVLADMGGVVADDETWREKVRIGRKETGKESVRIARS